MQDWVAHMRKRPGMYVVGDFNKLLQYLFENILENCLENPVFELEFHSGNKITIKITQIDTRKFLINLHQVNETNEWQNNFGLRLLIALSAEFSIAVEKSPYLEAWWGKKGEYEIAATTSWEEESNVRISYTLEEEIFKNVELTPESMNAFLKQFAFLNPALKITGNSNFHYPAGIFEQMDHYNTDRQPGFKLNIAAEINGYAYRISICNKLDQPFVKTYAGNIETRLGGSLEEGILEGLKLIGNKKWIRQELMIIAAVKGEKLTLIGATREKLDMPEVKKNAKKLVSDQVAVYLRSNPSPYPKTQNSPHS